MTAFLNYCLFATLVLARSTDAFKCGTSVTTECLGATDIRYDPTASNDAADQAEVWKKFGGYFVGKGRVQIRFPGASSLSSAYDLQLFINNTFDGSRQYNHRIAIYLGDPYFIDTYATTTYEKDGSLSFKGAPVALDLSGSPDEDEDPSQNGYFAYPVDENSAFSTYTQSNGNVGSESWYALGSNADEIRLLSDQFQSINGSLVLSATFSATNTRVTEQVWNLAVNAAYKTKVTSTVPTQPIPMTRSCFSEICPSEEDIWCKQDPNCSVSPFQEPSASLKPGATAGFVILGVFLLVLGLYGIHRFVNTRQAKRYKTIFAQRIAETVQVNKSMRALEPRDLAEEFKRIDSQTEDGLITKDDLWEFISSGKAGEISQSDFNALFAAIDTDRDGQVDFLAFCTFMGQCHDEYRSARADRMNLTDRSSRRESLADSAARRSFSRLSSHGSLMAMDIEEATRDFVDDEDEDPEEYMTDEHKRQAQEKKNEEMKKYIEKLGYVMTSQP